MELGGLIVGLGNPGEEYRNTRHNFGFLVVDALLELAGQQGAQRQLSGRKDDCLLWRCSFSRRASREWLLAQPQSYMNRSGEPVQRVAAYYRIATENILVLHDELDLPLGRMKLKQGGGSAGHNGIRSLEQMLGNGNFYRLRLGVGKAPGMNGASYVLGRFAAEERGALNACIAAAVKGVLLFIEQGPGKAQQFCNGFALPQDNANPA